MAEVSHSAFFVVLGLFFFVVTEASTPIQTYRAAVVEYQPVFQAGLENPLDNLLENAKRYAQYAEKAAQQGAQLIVFPEYGIVTFEWDDRWNYTREGVSFAFQDVPDPEKTSWNPCLHPEQHNNTAVLHILSCGARNNSIALLANLLSREPCENNTDPHCPIDGQYLYNTNVVFDKEGTLIARYHKNNLFQEAILNTPPKHEYVIFEIDGIKFASFICFDIYYEEPAIKLVTEKGIKNIIFSTASISETPLLLGPQLHSSWARGLGVNLIVSNYYKPNISRLGTGIYSSGRGALTEIFDISKNGSLLIADVPRNPAPVLRNFQLCSTPITPDHPANDTLKNGSYVYFVMTSKPSSKPVPPIHRVYNQPLSNFSAIYLDNPEGDVSLCHGEACCRLSYNFTQNDDPAVYALLAYDGIRPFSVYQLGMQLCAVMRCEIPGDLETCGRVTNTTASAVFHSMILTAQLDQEIVFPSFLTTDLQGLHSDKWFYYLEKCENKKSQSRIEMSGNLRSLSVAALYARIFDRDSSPQ